MTPDIVVDIGNSRMKWGRVVNGKIVETAVLPLYEQNHWIQQCDVKWGMHLSSIKWSIASVVPESLKHFLTWLQPRNNFPPPQVIDNESLLREAEKYFVFRTTVENPKQIGTDRLLSSLAARTLTPNRCSTVTISVGTAMTVDFVDDTGTHVGGAILPGPSLMAKSLHDYTANLPLIPLDRNAIPHVRGTNTEEAIELGIASAIRGAADRLVWYWVASTNSVPCVFVTGGDAFFFENFDFRSNTHSIVIDPFLTLEGIRLVAERLG